MVGLVKVREIELLTIFEKSLENVSLFSLFKLLLPKCMIFLFKVLTSIFERLLFSLFSDTFVGISMADTLETLPFLELLKLSEAYPLF